MGVDWTTRATTVIVSGDGIPCGRTYRYADPDEARRQFDLWVAQAIWFAVDGTRWCDVQLGNRIMRVRGYDSRQAPSVYDQIGRSRFEWDHQRKLQAVQKWRNACSLPNPPGT